MNQPQCPRCSKPLDRGEELHSLRCASCRGAFIAGDAVQQQMLEGAVHVPADAPATHVEVVPPPPSPPACPACNAPMELMQLADVLFDRCSACGGVWLDEGEALARVGGGLAAVGKFFLYTMSLPERTVRTTVGLAGGVAKEVSTRIVPGAFQNSSTYKILVHNGLRFMVEDVGGVKGEQKDATPQIDNYLARKTVGNFVGMAGIATLRFSPVWVLAVVSDVAYGSKAYLEELAEELQKEGLIAEDSAIGNIDDLLEALGNATGTTAQMFDTPPLSVDDLRETTGAIRSAVASIDPTTVLPHGEIKRMWEEMRALGKRENVGLFQVSSAMTLHALNKVADVGRGTFTGIRLAGNLFNRHILGHYTQALDDIREQGFYATVSAVSEPYIDAVWNNFSSKKESVTEDVLSGRLPVRMWGKVTGWFRRKPVVKPDANEGGEGSL